MSDVQDRRDSGASTDGAAIDTTTEKVSTQKAKSSKALRREALQRAAAKRAAAKRRRNIILSFVGVLAVAGAVVGLVNSARNDKTRPNASASSSANAPGAEATAPNQAPNQAASLPPGTDPKLSTKPTVGPGTGALTKLVVTPLVEGKGEPVKAGQTLTVNYVGVSYTNGKEFDSSWSGSGPVSFPIGVGQLIKGWDQGLIGVKVGSRVQLDIPSDLAYGDNGQVPGPLRFVVDVLSAK